MVSKEQAIERVCWLQELVAEELFKHSTPADCFCGTGGYEGMTFRNDGAVLAFIEEAVRRELARACLKNEARAKPMPDIFGEEDKQPRGLLAAMKEIRNRTRRPLP